MEIAATDTSRLEPGMNGTDLIQTLVLQFLQHDGYVETARAFAEDIKAQKEALNLDPNVKVDGINIKDDEDANNRQRTYPCLSVFAPAPSNLMQGSAELFWKETLIGH